MKQLTPGRWRGLNTTSLQDKQVFGILAFDQRTTLQRMLPDDTPYSAAVTLKHDIVGTLNTYASAVVIDPEYGLGPAMQMSGQRGLLLALEKSGYTGKSSERRTTFLPGWTPEKIRRMGANAVKMLVYYHPGANALTEEMEAMIREQVQACHAVDLPIFLEPVTYSIDPQHDKDSAEFAQQRPQIVVETAKRLSQTGADVLKMEFPVNAAYDTDETSWRKHCEALSSNVDIPWVLLSAGVDFATFERQVRVACACGASGFLAGRAIWKETVNMPPEARQAYLRSEATSRIKQLVEIATRSARPWTDFYTAPESAQDWYVNY
jgi:tagatose 1,6-diphosphate aldolase